MKRRLVAALLGTALLASVAFAPSVAVPQASAHHSGYAGYGCYGWDSPVVWYWAVQDCYAGQQSGNYVYIYHHYWGPGAPGSYYSWEPLW